MDVATKKNWQDTTTHLIIAIGKQLKMEKEDQILMMMCLNTPEKVKMFTGWARKKTKGNKIQSTPAQVMSAATRIGRGMEPLD